MTAAQFDLGLRLAAHQTRTLTPRTSTKRFTLRPDAMLISVLASPGDHSGLWGVAWATMNGRPAVALTADPRPWSAQVGLWEALGKAWAGWLTQCVLDHHQAQFVVADPAATERIVWSARKVASAETVDPLARAAARAFIAAQHASRVTGQQSIAAMSTVLREHYVTGQDPLDEGHLGLWASWPTLRPGWDAPQTSLPPGADGATAPLGAAWDKMTRRITREAGPEMIALLGQSVTPHIHKLVTARWHTLRAAAKVYANHPGRPVSAAVAQDIREAKNFVYLMTAERLPASRSAKARWVTLGDRELAASAWQTALWAEDDLERARGAASGDVLVGDAQGGRVLTVQQVLRVRPGDTLTTSDQTAATVRVTDLISVPQGLVVVTDSDLDGPVVAWPADASVRQPIPEVVPWTHANGTASPSLMDLPPGDLLAVVAALRVDA